MKTTTEFCVCGESFVERCICCDAVDVKPPTFVYATILMSGHLSCAFPVFSGPHLSFLVLHGQARFVLRGGRKHCVPSYPKEFPFQSICQLSVVLQRQ